nr:UL39 [Human alphaherpesvirus 2]QBH76792.1 UL39 [Human alphaherpesvirus 2]QBH78708.1 UL39 [Human alphaherpesvirus 2]QBH81606.1 UL39 [Human alphaherpesvirus 2]QBH85970.1 UL39 [Human alphaherpesvirus 2]
MVLSSDPPGPAAYRISDSSFVQCGSNCSMIIDGDVARGHLRDLEGATSTGAFVAISNVAAGGDGRTAVVALGGTSGPSATTSVGTQTSGEFLHGNPRTPEPQGPQAVPPPPPPPFPWGHECCARRDARGGAEKDVGAAESWSDGPSSDSETEDSDSSDEDTGSGSETLSRSSSIWAAGATDDDDSDSDSRSDDSVQPDVVVRRRWSDGPAPVAFPKPRRPGDSPGNPGLGAGTGPGSATDPRASADSDSAAHAAAPQADVAPVLDGQPTVGTDPGYPVPLELTPENAEAVARFLGDAVDREPALMLEYFCRCAREESKRVPPRTFGSAPRLTEDDFGLLNYALAEMRRLCLDLPPVPPNAYTPYHLREYATRLVNGFKPLVRRSARLYRILGILVHLRIRTREASFEEWMRSKEVDLDFGLTERLREHEAQLMILAQALNPYDCLIHSTPNTLVERGLQSALKYEEFYLKRFGGHYMESVFQMYTRIAGFLACRATRGMRHIALGRQGSWWEMFKFFFHRLYDHQIVPSTPAMLNLGTRNYYTSSCYLVNPQATTNQATLRAITGNVSAILARNGGIGLCMQAFNDASPGTASIMPALKVLDSLVAAHNKQSTRPTGACVYLEPWHSDVRAVLRMKGVLAGEEAQRCDNIFSALWMPDLFFKRLIRHLDGEKNVTWSLFDRDTSMSLADFHGEEFEKLYEHLEAMGFGETIPIQDLAYAIVRSAATTGSPFIMFKDAVNRHYIYDTQGAAIAGSNLCTEIVHPSCKRSSGVCNLGSVNLARCVSRRTFDFGMLRDAVQACVLMVNIMIDSTLQPTPQCARGHDNLRSMGIGMQGLHTACLKMGLDLESAEFRDLNTHIAEVMLLAAMKTSNALCVRGARPFSHFKRSMYRAGRFHWERFSNASPRYEGEWEMLRQSMMKHGLRNSQFIALMPTAASAQISDVSEGFAPLFTNLFSKVTRDGETLRPNTLLLKELERTFGGKRLLDAMDGLEAKQWSVAQALPCLDPAHPLRRFKTAFDYDQELLIDLCADRAPYVDHSQSMTLYVTEKADGTLPASTLVRLLVHAYKRGLKTGMYYCKVRKATNSGVFAGDDNIVCTSCAL